MATKLEGGGGQALVAGPQKTRTFFAAFLREKIILFDKLTIMIRLALVLELKHLYRVNL